MLAWTHVVAGVRDGGVDLAVVGAGIVGATVAAEASRRRPGARVLLLDRSLVGSGATRHSAALSTPTGATPSHRRLVQRAGRWYADLARAGGAPWRRPLVAYWIVREASVPAFLEEFAGHPAAPAGTADLERLRAAHPDLAVDLDEVVFRSGAGVWAGSAEAAARTLAAGLNETAGCACWEGVEVLDIRPVTGGCALRTRTGHEVRARQVVVATGPWLAAGPPAAGPGRTLRVKKVAALHLARRPEPDDPVVLFWDEDAFLLPLPASGCTLFSFYCDTWDVRPGSDALAIERRELDAALAVLARRSARLAASPAGARVFCDGYTPGRLPMVAEDPARPGVVLAGGCSGSGFRLAPALAELALDCLDLRARG